MSLLLLALQGKYAMYISCYYIEANCYLLALSRRFELLEKAAEFFVCPH